MRSQRGRQGGNTGPDLLKNRKATKWTSTTQKVVIKMEPPPARKIWIRAKAKGQNGVSLAGRWWPAFSAFWILYPLTQKQTQKVVIKMEPPPAKKKSGYAHCRSRARRSKTVQKQCTIRTKVLKQSRSSIPEFQDFCLFNDKVYLITVENKRKHGGKDQDSIQ